MSGKRTAEGWRKQKADRYGWHLFRVYGLTMDQFDALVAAQRGLCAMCGHAPTGRFNVDHDHATGAVRALLCGPCNRALGFYEKYGSMAAAYLDMHEPREALAR